MNRRSSHVGRFVVRLHSCAFLNTQPSFSRAYYISRHFYSNGLNISDANDGQGLSYLSKPSNIYLSMY